MRGATICVCISSRADGFQSTLLMRGATSSSLLAASISSHFNPRSSCEERRYRVSTRQDARTISIHAPHARSDGQQRGLISTRWYFNPRSSCEERPLASDTNNQDGLFQSTLLMRGATRFLSQRSWAADIFQSTLLMRGATCIVVSQLADGIFQSTLLMRGATCTRQAPDSLLAISIHAPHARSDCLHCIVA